MSVEPKSILLRQMRRSVLVLGVVVVLTLGWRMATEAETDMLKGPCLVASVLVGTRCMHETGKWGRLGIVFGGASVAGFVFGCAAFVSTLVVPLPEGTVAKWGSGVDAACLVLVLAGAFYFAWGGALALLFVGVAYVIERMRSVMTLDMIDEDPKES